jgi:Leucine-rich repeat (LRR) protein
VGSLTAAETLLLEHNQLALLPAEVGSLTALQYMWLQYNQLASLPAEVGSLNALQTLYLEHNQLASLPASISRLETNECAVGECIGIDQTQRLLLKALRPPLSTVRLKPFGGSESRQAGANLMKGTLCKRDWCCCKKHQTKHWKSSHNAAGGTAGSCCVVGYQKEMRRDKDEASAQHPPESITSYHVRKHELPVLAALCTRVPNCLLQSPSLSKNWTWWLRKSATATSPDGSTVRASGSLIELPNSPRPLPRFLVCCLQTCQ